ncbi:hypothetical protein [Sphingomonas sp. R86520]|uniref:hypothetical protein n=1 Tax=Sphingomonas sp. R86520 TaxID=3093859 RepID=UPI0036D3F41E
MAIGVGVDGRLARGGTGVVVNGGKNRITQARTVRKDGWTAARREGFLLALSMTANVTTSAVSVGITPSGAHALRRREPGFAALWGEALASGYDRLEEALLTATLAGLRGDPAGVVLEDAGNDPADMGAARACGEGEVGGEVGGEEGGAEMGVAVGDDGLTTMVAESGSGSGSGAGSSVLVGAMPGSGIVHLAGLQAVQVGLAMLARFRAAQAGGGGGKRPQHRRATVAETNASIAKKLDSLAQRLRASSVGEI